MISKLNNAIDDGLIKVIFTHIRNYLICMTIITAGFFALESQFVLLPGIISDDLVAGITILAGFTLALLNLYDGIYRLSKKRFHVIFDIFLIALYVIITLRLSEIIWHFRSAFHTGG